MGSDLYVNKILQWRDAGIKDAREGAFVPYWKSITAQERKDAPTHCGPNGSYPLGPGCAHVAAALHLAKTGHGHPDMGCITRYAARHGCGGAKEKD
jgi:hypothetical protein